MEKLTVSSEHCVSELYLLKAGMKVQGLLQVHLLPFDLIKQEVGVVPQLIALLADQVEGVVMVCCELVSVQYHHLSLPYQILQ